MRKWLIFQIFLDGVRWGRGCLRNTGTVRDSTLQKVTYLKANVWILITRTTSVKDSEANSSVEEATIHSEDIQTEKNNAFNHKDKKVVLWNMSNCSSVFWGGRPEDLKSLVIRVIPNVALQTHFTSSHVFFFIFISLSHFLTLFQLFFQLWSNSESVMVGVCLDCLDLPAFV